MISSLRTRRRLFIGIRDISEVNFDFSPILPISVCRKFDSSSRDSEFHPAREMQFAVGLRPRNPFTLLSNLAQCESVLRRNKIFILSIARMSSRKLESLGIPNTRAKNEDL